MDKRDWWIYVVMAFVVYALSYGLIWVTIKLLPPIKVTIV